MALQILLQLAYVLLCILFAYKNAQWIEDGKKILHGINGGLHLVVWAIICFVTDNYFLVFVLPLLGRATFDASLNVFRDGWINIWYVSVYPKSIVDKVEKSIFKKDGRTPKIIYVSLAIVLNFFILK